jgi:hypothetical protein
MQLKPIPRVEQITPEQFRKSYFEKQFPVVIKNFAKNWPRLY